jgi:uncharacterized protein (DUF1800 family)
MTDPKIMHAINRLSFGPQPGDIEKIGGMGIEAYIQSQLNPQPIKESDVVTRKLNSLPILKLKPLEIFYYELKNKKSVPPPATVIFEQLITAHLVRAINSQRQLQELMVGFWFNHFNVFARKPFVLSHVPSYEEHAIRPNALGKFRNLLGAVAKHPAMQLYLDNWLNTSPENTRKSWTFKGLNENFARELMELHTLGDTAIYTEGDVIALARVFTGWSITPGFYYTKGIPPNPDPLGFHFDKERHDFSDKVFLGKTIKGSGLAEGEQALDILASHPSTAKHISYKLAQYFLGDRPPASLVSKLTQQFLATGGDIKAVLTTLFKANEFFSPQNYNTKFKNPFRFIVSAFRATQQPVTNYRQANFFVDSLGMPAYLCFSPAGYSETQETWLNPQAMLVRINLATTLGRGTPEQAVDPDKLAKALGNNFSPRTRQVLDTTSSKLKAAVILASPEFMKH